MEIKSAEQKDNSNQINIWTEKKRNQIDVNSCDEFASSCVQHSFCVFLFSFRYSRSACIKHNRKPIIWKTCWLKWEEKKPTEWSSDNKKAFSGPIKQ